MTMAISESPSPFCERSFRFAEPIYGAVSQDENHRESSLLTITRLSSTIMSFVWM